MKRILITGAGPTGVTGRYLADALEEKYIVLRPARSDFDLTDAVATRTYISRSRPDVILHSATHTSHSNMPDCEDNLRMFFNLAHLDDAYEKLIYFGSGAEYGKDKNIIQAVETSIGSNIPVDSYGFSKLVQTWYIRERKNIVNLRLFGMLGIFEDYRRNFVSNLCTKALLDIPLTIRQDCRFSYLDIDDLVSMVVWAIENDTQYSDYNACNNQYFYLSEIAQIVLDVSEKVLPLTIFKDGLNFEYTGDGSRLLQESNIHCQTMRQSIEKLYSYFSKFESSFTPELVKKSQ